MGKVRLRDKGEKPEDGSGERLTVDLKPIRVAGVVVCKADIMEALRVYVPALADIQVTEDGEHFWLMLKEDDSREDQTAE